MLEGSTDRLLGEFIVQESATNITYITWETDVRVTQIWPTNGVSGLLSQIGDGFLYTFSFASTHSRAQECGLLFMDKESSCKIV